MATMSLMRRAAQRVGRAFQVGSALRALRKDDLSRMAIGGNPGPQGILTGLLSSGMSTPPLINTRSILEGYDTMPWLRACSDKIGSALGMTDWRLYAVGAAPAAPAAAAAGVPAAGRYVFNPDELAHAAGDVVTEMLGRRLRAIRGRLEPWAEHDHILQRQVGRARWKRLDSLRRSGRLQEIAEHPFYDALERPNPFMDRMGLVKLTETGLDLVGDAFWLKQRNGAGVPVGYWPLPPHWVVETPTPVRPRFRLSWAGWQRDIPETEIRWFHEPAPVHPYERGSGVGFALGDELEIDEYLAKMTKQMFFNDADPKWIFAGGEGTSVEEMRRLERDFLNKNQGFWRKFKPYFLAGGGDDIHKRIHEFQRPTMEQLVYPGLRKAQRDIVIQTYGAPPELFGITENSNRATVEAAEYLFARWVLLPRGERLRAALQAEATQEFDERLVLDFPSPVAEDKAYELDVRKASAWAWSADEWRHLGGGHPVEDDKGKVYLVPLNSHTTTDLTDATQRPLPGPAGGAPPPPEGGKALAELSATVATMLEGLGARTVTVGEVNYNSLPAPVGEGMERAVGTVAAAAGEATVAAATATHAAQRAVDAVQKIVAAPHKTVVRAEVNVPPAAAPTLILPDVLRVAVAELPPKDEETAVVERDDKGIAVTRTRTRRKA